MAPNRPHCTVPMCQEKSVLSLYLYICKERRIRSIPSPFWSSPPSRPSFLDPTSPHWKGRTEVGSCSTEPSRETSSLFPSRRRRLLPPSLAPSRLGYDIRQSYMRFPLASPPITTRRLPARTSPFYGKSKDVNMTIGESAQSTFLPPPSFLLPLTRSNLGKFTTSPSSSLPRTNQEEASSPANPSLGRKEDEEENIFQPCKRGHI